MSRIFISYRRSISRYAAEILHQFCVSQFGQKFIFFDKETIHPGESFPDRISWALANCEVFLPLIGQGWHEVQDENGFRLQQPDDWVRHEITTILGRNKDRPNSVLMIPLVEAGASMPAPNQLPEELKLLASQSFVNFNDLSYLDLITPMIEEHLGCPPMGEFGMRILAQRPDWSRRDQYRFRYARNSADLDTFVELSDAEVVIAGANPGLRGQERKKLYERWCQWTATDENIPWYDPENRTLCFAILDQKQVDETWLPICISIILPLSVNGGRHLRLVRRSDKNYSEKRNASTLQGEDFVRESSERLLFDTWIVRQRTSSTNTLTDRVHRYDHHQWGVALFLWHIGEFWNPDHGAAVTFLCEPDNPKIAMMLNDLRFIEENRNTVSGNLFILKYPLDEDKFGEEDYESINRVLDNIRQLRLKVKPFKDGENSKNHYYVLP